MEVDRRSRSSRRAPACDSPTRPSERRGTLAVSEAAATVGHGTTSTT